MRDGEEKASSRYSVITVDSIIEDELISPMPAPTLRALLLVIYKSLIYGLELMIDNPPPLSTLVIKLSKASGSAAKLIKSLKETSL